MSVRLIGLAMDGGPDQSAQRFVLLAIADHAGDDGRAFPGQELLAEKTALSEKTVARSLAELEQSGFLTIRRREAKVDTSRGPVRKGSLYCLNVRMLEARAESVRAAREERRTGRTRIRREDTVSGHHKHSQAESMTYEPSPDMVSGDEETPEEQASPVEKSVEEWTEKAERAISEPRRPDIEGRDDQTSGIDDWTWCPRRPDIEGLPNKEEPSRNRQEEPSREPEELKAPPAAGEPDEDGSAEKAGLWTAFQRELKTDLASVPLNLAALRRFDELQPGVNDFEAAFRDWWLLDVQTRSWGVAFLVGAQDAVATRQGCVKYAARLAKIARKVYFLSPQTAVRFVVEEQRAA